MRITMVLPCFGRPARTKRMIECLANQSINGWEAFIIGDHCPDFLNILRAEWFQDFKATASAEGNTVIAFNTSRFYGGFGYAAINFAIQHAMGKYFVFGGNDDVILPNHFEHYLSGIEKTDLDFAYYNTWVDPHNMIRMSQPIFGAIGHSELIVRTEFLKTIEPHDALYGHDWRFIENMLLRTTYHEKIPGENPTYHVMSVPGKTKDVID